MRLRLLQALFDFNALRGLYDPFESA